MDELVEPVAMMDVLDPSVLLPPAPTVGCRESERALWSRMLAAVERGVASQHFTVQCAIIQTSQESAISSGSGGSGGSHSQDNNDDDDDDDDDVDATSARESASLVGSNRAGYHSFPPPLGLMGEHGSSIDYTHTSLTALSHSSSGTGSLEVDDRHFTTVTQSFATAKERGASVISRPGSSSGSAAAPIFKPARQHDTSPVRGGGEGEAAGEQDDASPSEAVAGGGDAHTHCEVILTDLARRMAEESCISDQDGVLGFLLDSGMPVAPELLELACERNAVNCARLLHERCELRFHNEMMMRAVVDVHRDLALLISTTNMPQPFTADEVRQMLVAAVSAISLELVAASRHCCRSSGLVMPDIIKPVGASLLSALIENTLRSSAHADVEVGAKLLHFLTRQGLPLPADFARPPDGRTANARRKHDMLCCFLETLISFSESVLTAHWASLPLSFCSADIFFRNSNPLMLVRVDLSSNSLSSLPSVLFDGSMPTLRMLNASHNCLMDLDNLQSIAGDFSGSRLETLDLSFNQMANFPSWLNQLPCLLKLNLAHCLKEQAEASATLSHNVVQISPFPSAKPPSRKSIAQQWAALHLEELDMSGNDLSELPHFVQALAFLHLLDVSNNMLASLTSVCQGCVRLVTLRASCNKLLDTSVDFEGEKAPLLAKFPKSWHYTLSDVDLSRNGLLEVPPQLCLAQSLAKLDLSYNDIGRVPASLQWSSVRLSVLNLAHNQLGDDGFETFFDDEIISGNRAKVSPFQGRRVRTQWQALHRVERRSVGSPPTAAGTSGKPQSHKSSDSVVELPSDKLFSLVTLDLSGNRLVHVPISVCHIKSLVTLNLSDNSSLCELRQEMGFLTSLFWLHLNNCDKIQKQIEPFMEASSVQGKPPFLRVRDFLSGLLTKLRQARTYYGLKLPVVGQEMSGKTQLISALQAPNGKASIAKSVKRKREHGCVRSDLFLNVDGQPVTKSSADEASVDSGRLLALDAWDISDLDVLLVMRGALFQRRCLFLVLWNVKSGMEGLEGASEWLRNIQLLSQNARAIVVATHTDRSVPADQRALYKNHVGSVTNVPMCFVCSSQGGNGIAELRRTIYSEGRLLCEKLPAVPRSYITLHRRFTQPTRRDNPAAPLLARVGAHGIMADSDVLQVYNITEDVRRDLLDEEEILKAGCFLHDIGTFVHFHDLFKNLSQFYFTNINWLVGTITHFMNHHHLYVDAGILTPIASLALFGEQIQDEESLKAFMALLEKMRVVFSIGAGRRCRYLVTFALPKEKPAHEVNTVHLADSFCIKKIKRLFSFNRVPPELWGVLVSQLQVKLENWCRGQFKGMDQQLTLVHTIMWARGVIGFLPDSAFKVESVEGIQLRGSSIIFPGINVIVISTNDRYSVLTLIMQHINSLLEETFINIKGSHLVDEYETKMCVVPCPACSLNYIVLGSAESVAAMQVEGTQLHSTPPHFLNLSECAGLLALQKTDVCSNTGQILRPEELVPDLMFCDLPKELVIDRVDVQAGTMLDSGAYGTVYRCVINGKDVAVKVYTTDAMLQQQHELSTMRTSDGGFVRHSLRNTMPTDTAASHAYKSDLGEVGGPMLRSLEEAQREASRLNRLAHPCIVTFLGASIHPPCIILEYAPLGSLSKYLRDRVKTVSEMLAAGAEISQLVVPEFPNGVLGRQLTHQIAYQVTLGLQHIHKHGMIYKDLKADNVLLFSVDRNVIPNVKLTDYGIAAEEIPGVEITAVTGTLGYQAPEVVLRGTLSGKIDVYSYAMLLYELLEGNLPFYRERTDMKTPMQLNSLVICGMRPGLTVKPSLVRLDALMHRCWQQSPEGRPSPHDIIAAMEKPEFSLQNRELSSLTRSGDFVHYFCTRKVYSVEERMSMIESARDLESTTAYNESDQSLLGTPHLGPALRFHISPSSSRKSSDYRSRSSDFGSGSTNSLIDDTVDVLSYELLFVAFGEGSHRSFSLIDSSSDAVVGGPDTFPGPSVRCAVTARSTLWLGTSCYGNNGSRVEVFNLLPPCRLHEMLRFSEESSVMCMATIDYEADSDASCVDRIDRALSSSEPGQSQQPSAISVVLAGLGDGSLLVFFGSYQKDGFKVDNLNWNKTRIVLQENHDSSVHAVVVIKSTEVWCARGGDIIVIDVNPQSQTCDVTGSIQLHQNTLRPDLPVTALTLLDGYVWASLLNQNVLLKFSVEHRTLLGCIQLSEFGAEPPAHQRLSPDLPPRLLLRNFRPASFHARKASGESVDGVSFDRAPATLARSVVFARQASTADELESDSPPSWRSKQLQQAQRQVPVLPDSVCAIKPVHDTLWVGLEDGAMLVLSSSAAPDGYRGDSNEQQASAAKEDAAKLSRTPSVPKDRRSQLGELQEVEEDADKEASRPRDSGAFMADNETPVQERPDRLLSAGLHPLEEHFQLRSRPQSHTLLGRVRLPKGDPFYDRPVRHMAVTPSNLVITSTPKQRQPVNVVPSESFSFTKVIAPLHVWDAWTEKQWQHFYSAISQLHVA